MNTPHERATPDALARLTHQDPRIRRIALRDLARATPLDQGALAAVVESLARESDTDARCLAASLLGKHAHEQARPLLASILADPLTDALTAHHARVALDRIDIRNRPGWGGPPPAGTMPA